ncbi:transposase domain-containing protein [Clostridium tyrobutyricum]
MVSNRYDCRVKTIIYSIVQTAKNNKLKPYNYFEFLLTEIPKHM